MEKLNNLSLSKKKMSTSLAMEYITKNTNDFEWPESGKFIFEGKKLNSQENFCRTEITDNFMDIVTESVYIYNLPDPVVVGKKLARLIEKNSQMLAQLEYVARGTDPEDVLNGHVTLMCQILRCSDALWNCWPEYMSEPVTIHLNKSTPLFHLGLVAESLFMSPRKSCLIVVSDKDMKHLCQFFVDLCRDAGVIVSTVYINEETIQSEPTFQALKACPEMTGCTGVITEWSDLDSAIDVFIHSSVTAPWRLKQIYVQESVFENFKLALTAKSRTPASDHIIVENKTFLIEGLLSFSTSGIPTQAYRTTKELLSLIETPYLSVWAANSAESNEIALKTSANIVWVNEYGSFDGPPRAAISVYSSLFYSPLFTLNTKDYEDLNLAMRTWSLMKTGERLEVIIDALEATDGDVITALLPELRDKWRSDDLIQVTDKTVCFGIQKPMGIIYSQCENEREPLYRVLKALVNGNSVVLSNDSSDLPVREELAMRGVPISKEPESNSSDYDDNEETVDIMRFSLLMEKLKIIRTNYGTIFAN